MSRHATIGDSYLSALTNSIYCRA